MYLHVAFNILMVGIKNRVYVECSINCKLLFSCDTCCVTHMVLPSVRKQTLRLVFLYNRVVPTSAYLSE